MRRWLATLALLFPPLALAPSSPALSPTVPFLQRAEWDIGTLTLQKSSSPTERTSSDTIKIAGDLRIPEHRMVRLTADGVDKNFACDWEVEPSSHADYEVWNDNRDLRFTGPPGLYTVRLTVFGVKDGKASLKKSRVEVRIDGKSPAPTPPAQPCIWCSGNPPPDPTPPGPAPIPLTGNRVLIVYESKVEQTPEHRAILFGQQMRDYLNTRCMVGPDGTTREFRIFDQHTPLEGAAEHWKAAMARPRTQIPWLIISTGTSGYEGPLPATEAETLTLLKKYLGG